MPTSFGGIGRPLGGVISVRRTEYEAWSANASQNTARANETGVASR
jgi:hypothetical protein